MAAYQAPDLCVQGAAHPLLQEIYTVSNEHSPSPAAAEMEVLKAEIKILKELVKDMRQRLDQIENELTALRNLF